MPAKVEEDTQGTGEGLPTLDGPKTKITAIREQLLANPNLFFAGEIHHYQPHRPEYATLSFPETIETVNMIVGSRSPQFDSAQLNTFMDSLVSGVELSGSRAAYIGDGGALMLGRLYFDETIGLRRTALTETIETTEPETLTRAGRKVGIGSRHVEAECALQRRFFVTVYPDTLSASEVYEYLQGVESGTVQPDIRNISTEFSLKPSQIQQLEKQHRKPDPRFKGIFPSKY